MSLFQLIKHHPFKFLLSMLISVGLLILVFKDVSWGKFWETLTNVQYGWLLVGAALLAYSIYLRAARWRILLQKQREFTTHQLFKAEMIGYMGNDVLPFRAGEVLRAWLVGHWGNLPISGVGATIVVERGLDMFSFGILAGIYLLAWPWLPLARTLGAVALGAVVLLILLSTWMNRHHEQYQDRLRSWAQRAESKGRGKLASQLLAGFEGLESIWRMPRLGLVTLQTLGLWVLYVLITYCGLLAFHFPLTPAQYFHATALLLIFTTLSLSIPAAPGAVGTYHGAAVAALSFFQVGAEGARAFALVFHFVNYLVMTLPGVWYAFREGLKLTAALEEGEEELETSRRNPLEG